MYSNSEICDKLRGNKFSPMKQGDLDVFLDIVRLRFLELEDEIRVLKEREEYSKLLKETNRLLEKYKGEEK